VISGGLVEFVLVDLESILLLARVTSSHAQIHPIQKEREQAWMDHKTVSMELETPKRFGIEWKRDILLSWDLKIALVFVIELDSSISSLSSSSSSLCALVILSSGIFESSIELIIKDKDSTSIVRYARS
jgi:hypothetical protein